MKLSLVIVASFLRFFVSAHRHGHHDGGHCGPAKLLSATDRHGRQISYAGKTLEQWGNYWWGEWAYTFSKDNSPVTDTTGAKADQKQPPNVFLLAGSYNSNQTITRNTCVSRHEYIFFPVFNSIIWTNPSDGPDWIEYLDTLIACAGQDPAAFPTLAEKSSAGIEYYVTKNLVDLNMTLIVDGCARNPKMNFVVTPPEHTFPLPVAAEYSTEEGNHDAAQAGYYVMIAPFKHKGKHSIKIRASFSKFACFNYSRTFRLSVDYNLDIV